MQYIKWVSNVVPIKKKISKIRVYCDYNDLNVAILKDEYVMPLVDQLVDVEAMNVIMSFMDGNVG